MEDTVEKNQFMLVRFIGTPSTLLVHYIGASSKCNPQ